MTVTTAASIMLMISILPIPPQPQLDALPVAPWLQPADDSWHAGEPLFDIADSNSGTSARGWLAIDNENIFLRVIVRDDMHVNDKTESNIWQGDSIQVGFSAYGESRSRDAYVGPHDAALAFALTSSGPVAWAYHHGRPGGTGEMSGIELDIHRDNETSATTYDITMPWSEFQAQPGLSPVLSLAVQINDSDDGDRQTRLNFGSGAGGVPRPALFQQVRLAPPTAPLLAARVTRTELWRPGDSGEIVLAVFGQPDLTIQTSLGDLSKTLAVPADDGATDIRRFSIQGIARQLPDRAVPFELTVLDASGNEVLSCSAELQAGRLIIDTLNSRIDAIAANSPHPLFTRHLRTVQAVANIEWQLAQTQLETTTALAEDAVKYAQQILDGLDGDAAEWETYLQRRRKLVIGFSNPSDRTVQYYMATLPLNWQEDKTYPMIVFLHGGGTSHVALNVAASPFNGRRGREPSERFEGDFNHIYIEPYARGRYGYVDIAEQDVYLAVDDAIETLNADPDRVCLTGFSMGGYGAWAIAAHSPDRWSAVCINAGGDNFAPTGIGLGRNYLGLPVRISHGDADPAVPISQGRDLVEELKRHGVEPEFIILPGVGHDYYDTPHESENLRWLTQHERGRPDHFGFTADTGRYLGRNGIYLHRDPAISHAPWFVCRIDGNTVHLTSEGAPFIDVNLGQGGIGLDSDVVVHHNGEKCYQGPAVSIRVDTARGAARPAGPRSQNIRR